MKGCLLLVAAFLLWPGCSSQNECEEPDEIDFGEIVSAQKATYLENDRVQYRCNPSYVLEGPEWIQCKGQKWTPHPPKCLAPCSITRQQLAAKNLFLFGNQRKAQLIQSDQSLQFQCNEGYVLVVPSVRKCVDGYMDFPLCISEITCNSPSILHGSFRPRRTIYHDGDLIQIQCDSGFTFEPDNGEKVVECTKNGWSPPPKCIDIEGECGRPPAVDNADIVETLKETYVQSESVTYQCQNLYIMEGSARVTCQNGQWSQTPVCKGKGCNYVRIRNGRMENNYEHYRQFPKREGETIRFYCYSGFLPKGKQIWQTATCINSHFEPELKCFKTCDPSLYFYHGRIIYNYWNTYIEGDSISFVCDNGYSPANQQSSITCTKKGWSPAPRCIRPDIKGRCGRPPPVDNGDIVETLKETYVQSESVTYQCQNLYIMEGSARVTCQNGQWSQTPVCRGLWMDYLSSIDIEGECGRPPAVDNADIVETLKETYVQSESVTYQCQNLYIMEGSARVTCQNGQWSQTPVCRGLWMDYLSSIDIEGECGRPPAVDNADIVETLKETYVQSESVTYQCQNLYIMEGSARVTCQNGQWSQTPVCRDTEGKCGRPPHVENGDIVDSLKPIYLHSESVTYQCQNFYTMKGSARVTCQNGHWSQTPTCKVPCTASEEDMREHNIRLKWRRGDKIYSEDGNTVEFLCLRGYKPHPNTGPLRVNCVDGKFDYPNCIPRLTDIYKSI